MQQKVNVSTLRVFGDIRVKCGSDAAEYTVLLVYRNDLESRM